MANHQSPHPLPVKTKPIVDAQARYRATLRVTVIGSILDLLLGVVKILVGLFSHSQALIADGIHSLSDLLTDILVIYAAKHAAVEADDDHPYGHARVETVATVILGISLLVLAIGICSDAIRRLFMPEDLLQPGKWSLVVAVVSIVSKETIYHYTMHVANQLRSNMLKANAWHSRSDAISSVIVVIGIVGSMYGLTYLDSVAAIGVGLMIGKIGWNLGWHGLRELMDTGLGADRLQAIKQIIMDNSGVKTLHMLRTRMMGADALVDVHIQVESDLSVSEGHFISATVSKSIIEQIEEVREVMVHIDPEDDEKVKPSVGLPDRTKVIALLMQNWADIPASMQIRHTTLHYLDGKVSVDVVLPLSLLTELGDNAAGLEMQLSSAAKNDENIACVKVYFSNAPK